MLETNEITKTKTAINNDSHFITLLLTAENPQSLKGLANQYLNFIKSTPHNLLDICHSLLSCNNFLPHKLIINCWNKEELCSLLEKFISDNNKPKTNNQLYFNDTLASKSKIAYVFSGQGGQWFAMGRNLMATEPIFKEAIEEVNESLKNLAGWSLITELNKDKMESLINKTEIVQPAIFALQVGLVKLLEYYGVKAEGVIGHSVGEVAASYTAGALSLKEAVYIIYHRSRIQAKQANTGKILAVNIGAEEAIMDIKDYNNRISIATINGPKMLTISGDEEALRELADLYTQKGYFNRFVNTEVPYHSHYMDSLKEELTSYLGHLAVKPAAIPLYSTISAKQESGLHLTGDYWFKNVRYPVLLTDTIVKMVEDGFNIFIEIGPHPVLVEGISSLLSANSHSGVVFSLMHRKFEDESSYFRQNLARLVTNNIRVDIEKLLKWKGSYVPLPF